MVDKVLEPADLASPRNGLWVEYRREYPSPMVFGKVVQIREPTLTESANIRTCRYENTRRHNDMTSVDLARLACSLHGAKTKHT